MTTSLEAKKDGTGLFSTTPAPVGQTAMRLPTPPLCSPPHQFILCADGGGSKVNVVIRNEDGLEVRGTAGPCNVQSVGYASATQALLLATYRALAQLPPSLLPKDLVIPPIEMILPPQNLCSSPPSPHLLPACPATYTPSQPQPVRILGRKQLPTPPSSVGSAPTTIHHLPSVMHHLTLAPPSSSASCTEAPALHSDVGPTAGRSPGSSRASTPSSMTIANPSLVSQTHNSTTMPITRTRLMPINSPIFKFAWLGLAGISCRADEEAFAKVIAKPLGLDESRVKVTNDVNLLAAPALDLPGIDHVLALVAGTGTVGRTIRVSEGEKKGLPLEDVAVARGWGYLLCDEGSAFWIGRLAIRSLLSHADRQASSSIYSSPIPPLLPLHTDLLSYFGTKDPVDLINIASLTAPGMLDQGENLGEATSRRNALIAGAARLVIRWAFPEDGSRDSTGLPTPPGSENASESGSDEGSETSQTESEIQELEHASHLAALALAGQAVRPLVELTLSLLGDRTVVVPERAVLTMGGGLMMSEGYRSLLLDGLAKEGIRFERTVVVRDAAGVGARGLGHVQWA